MKFVCCIAFFLAGCRYIVYSQLCTGSLGDPIVNITFGVDSTPAQPLPADQTSYEYSGKGCPAENKYSILNFIFGCFDNSWQPLTNDHTNNGGGKYMLVNAGGAKKDFFVYTIKDLCPGTTYEFAAWIKNVLRPSACNHNATDPNLTFNVETLSGTVIATYNSGNIYKEENAAWKQYGMLFKTSATETDAVLRITNTAVFSGCGNALALDDITLRACGPQVVAKVNSSGLQNEDVCEENKTVLVLSASYSGASFTNPVFQWQALADNYSKWQDITGANSNTYTRPASVYGSYIYRMVIAEAGSYSLPQCRIASNQVLINVKQAPFVQVTNYIYGCLDGDVVLMASGANKYSWTGPNGYISAEQRPVLKRVQYADAGLYKVIGTTNLGCKNADSTFLRVYPNVTATASGGAVICEGTSAQLAASGGTRYRWEPANSLSNDTIATPLASPVENTRYKIWVSNQYGCTDTGHVNINVWKKPVANAGPDLKTRAGVPITLKGSAKGADVSWYWSPSNSLSATRQLNPAANPTSTTSYRLNVVSPHGCDTSTDEVTVTVFEKVLIPNAFSPNGDGINDTWVIEPLYLFEESITEVFNRFGQVVYHSKGYNTPWNGASNGKPIPVGTYYYIINLRVNNEPNITGSVTILR